MPVLHLFISHWLFFSSLFLIFFLLWPIQPVSFSLGILAFFFFLPHLLLSFFLQQLHISSFYFLSFLRWGPTVSRQRWLMAAAAMANWKGAAAMASRLSTVGFCTVRPWLCRFGFSLICRWWWLKRRNGGGAQVQRLGGHGLNEMMTELIWIWWFLFWRKQQRMALWWLRCWLIDCEMADLDWQKNCRFGLGVWWLNCRTNLGRIGEEIDNYQLCFVCRNKRKTEKGGTGWILLWWNCEFVMWWLWWWEQRGLGEKWGWDNCRRKDGWGQKAQERSSCTRKLWEQRTDCRIESNQREGWEEKASRRLARTPKKGGTGRRKKAPGHLIMVVMWT